MQDYKAYKKVSPILLIRSSRNLRLHIVQVLFKCEDTDLFQ